MGGAEAAREIMKGEKGHARESHNAAHIERGGEEAHQQHGSPEPSSRTHGGKVVTNNVERFCQRLGAMDYWLELAELVDFWSGLGKLIALLGTLGHLTQASQGHSKSASYEKDWSHLPDWLYGDAPMNASTAARSVKKSDEDIPVPPLVKSAVLWALMFRPNKLIELGKSTGKLVRMAGLVIKSGQLGLMDWSGVFLAISSNTRYQIINGLERVVEASPVAKRVPPVAMAFTIGVRFANNIYGGMQFVDWARWSGVQ
ncbi:hypothetical protein ZIOFF_028053 [Zingiber officinale]|uniref:Uncharacterized protein n=1 Tax=Zingiber officinale TaxID=94328 RepID=A0A8J5H5D4_ZINOF|nr:hypothetical protein ZIOFF_028053 [Zingiber officinale]